jgi:hypothetical protein
MSIPPRRVRHSLDSDPKEGTVQYMLLIYQDEQGWPQLADEERSRLMQEYFAFTDEVRASGALVASDPLQPTSSATTVEVRDGETLTTDGPFAETKEQLGGYYLVDVESLDEALHWAAKIPSARFGKIEVRPIMQIPVEARQA